MNNFRSNIIMNVIDVNNLEQALNENNMQLLNGVLSPSTDIKISNENGNALSLKEDGLYVKSIDDKIKSISNLLNNKIWGHYVIGTCNYSLSVPTTKYEGIITIPINVAFIPKKVFVGFNTISGGTASTYHMHTNCFWVSDSCSPWFFYVNDYDGTWSGLGIATYIIRYNKNKIDVGVYSAKITKDEYFSGSDAASKITYNMTQWVAIG